MEKIRRRISLIRRLSRANALPPAHCLLRRATDRLHRRIDRTSLLASLAGPGVTLATYRPAMQALRRAYQTIDLLLFERAHLCPADVPPYSPRVPSIDRDLLALSAFAGQTPNMPRRSGLQAPETEAAYLGMRYVVEGAQLGSRVIFRHLQTAFGADVNAFGSFWLPGSPMQGSWPEVLKSLARVETRESLAAAARAARLTFQHMEMCLAPNAAEAQ